jgi:hypothetical protein
MAQNNQLTQTIGQLVVVLQAQVNLGYSVPSVREVNLVKIELFDSTSNLITWIESFEKATTANGLNDARRLAVVPVYLNGTAATWLQEYLANINTVPVHWVHAANANANLIAQTFIQPFIN